MTAAPVTAAPTSRRRSVLVGILACVAVTLSATTLWVHQVALNTDRYVDVVRQVAADPGVVFEVSSGLAERIVDRFAIPRLVKPLLQNWIRDQIAMFMATDDFLVGDPNAPEFRCRAGGRQEERPAVPVRTSRALSVRRIRWLRRQSPTRVPAVAVVLAPDGGAG